MRWIKLFLLSTLLALSGAVYADQALWEKSTLNQILKRGELRIGLEAGYMPFEMRDKQGALIGFDIDLARLMAKYMGVKVTFVNTSWDGIIPALLTNKFDVLMGGMTITPERNLQVNFCDPYIVIGQTVLLAKKHEGKVLDYRTLNAPSFTVISKLGTTGDLAARKYFAKAKLKQFESEADAALEVRSGRADAFVYDLPFNAIYYNQYRGKVAYLPQPFTQEALAWAVRKGDPDTLNWLNHYLAQIKRDGIYDALYKKWFEGTAWLQNVN
jgi:polar amino acid transport system substrate-binding protein